MLSVLSGLKWLSMSCLVLSAGWLLLVLIAANLKPKQTISVFDGNGKLIAGGVRRVVLRPEYWWHDVAVKFGPYTAVLIVSVFVFWYCRKRLGAASSAA
jgi:hypothetical protein